MVLCVSDSSVRPEAKQKQLCHILETISHLDLFSPSVLDIFLCQLYMRSFYTTCNVTILNHAIPNTLAYWINVYF